MINYLSIDLETTGLDPQNHQILELAVIYDNGAELDKLPFFHCYVRHNQIVGEPAALVLNQRCLEALATGHSWVDNIQVVEDKDVGYLLHNFFFKLRENHGDSKFTVFGKNFGSFDYQFLRNLPNRYRTAKEIYWPFDFVLGM